MIKVSNLFFYYNRFRALNNINFTLPQGVIGGFIGPNGSGKSTTFKILTGSLVPEQGEVWINDYSARHNPMEVRRLVGYMQESPFLYKELKVVEYLRFVAKIKDVEGRKLNDEVERIVHKCRLEKVKTFLIGQLSKGNRQRVAMAQALIGSPRILFLDEPMSAMDPAQTIEMRKMIKSLAGDTTILMSSHVLSEISQLCDYVILIKEGTIHYEGSLKSVNQGSESVSKRLIIKFRYLDDSFKEDITQVTKATLVGINLANDELEYEYEDEDQFYNNFYQLIATKKMPVLEFKRPEVNLEKFFQ